MPITDAQKRAIARIQLTAGGKIRWGTGFLVEGDRLLLTAFHVVGDPKTKASFPEPYYVGFLDPASNQRFNTHASLVGNEYDAEDDWALLQCKELPPGAAPFQLAPLRSGYALKYTTYGFPKEAPDLGQVYEGSVQSTGEIVQLSTGRSSGDGALLEGLSGSPCLVNGRAVGLILNVNEWEETAGQLHAQDHALFALPVTRLRSKALSLPTADLPPFHADVTLCLSDAGAKLKDAALALQIPTPDNYRSDDLRSAVSEAMLRGGIDVTRAGLRSLGGGVAEKKGKIILDLSASLWVDEAAAGCVERSFSTRPWKHAVLNASEPLTGRHYVHRAGYPRAGHPGWLRRLRDVSDAHQEERIEGILEDVRDVLASVLKCAPGDVKDSLEAAAKREEEEERKGNPPMPIIVTLPRPAPAPKDLDALRAAFPAVCFVVLAGDEPADALRATYGGDLVEPVILPGQERAVREAHTRAREELAEIHATLRQYEDEA